MAWAEAITLSTAAITSSRVSRPSTDSNWPANEASSESSATPDERTTQGPGPTHSSASASDGRRGRPPSGMTKPSGTRWPARRRAASDATLRPTRVGSSADARGMGSRGTGRPAAPYSSSSDTPAFMIVLSSLETRPSRARRASRPMPRRRRGPLGRWTGRTALSAGASRSPRRTCGSPPPPIAPPLPASGGARPQWPAREATHVIVDRAIARGELPAGTDPAFVIELVGGPLWFRTFVVGKPADDEYVDRVVDALLGGLTR